MQEIIDNLYAVAPEHSGVESSRLTRMVTLSKLHTSQKYFGDLYSYAVALRTAHMLTVSDREGSSGNLQGKREGDLSVNFGISGSLDTRLDVTSYGSMLMDLIRTRSITAGTSRA